MGPARRQPSTTWERKRCGQEAQFIKEMFTAADTSDFVGSVRCNTPEEGLFTGVAVELDAVNRISTTLPVVREVTSQE